MYLEIHAEDLLEQAFAPAKTYQTITDLWNTKNAVGNEIFVSSIQSQDSLGNWNVPAITQQEPLLIRIAKWFLRITIVLSITMVIYNGVGYIVESAKWGEVKNATKNIALIVGGVLLALFSLVIINLLRSLTLSSLTLWG